MLFCPITNFLESSLSILIMFPSGSSLWSSYCAFSKAWSKQSGLSRYFSNLSRVLSAGLLIISTFAIQNKWDLKWIYTGRGLEEWGEAFLLLKWLRHFVMWCVNWDLLFDVLGRCILSLFIIKIIIYIIQDLNHI